MLPDKRGAAKAAPLSEPMSCDYFSLKFAEIDEPSAVVTVTT
jgi:hypothetical protein